MRRHAICLAAGVSCVAAGAFAGGVERSNQSVAILFEEGDYAEFSLGATSPDVSGTLGGGALSSGDMLASRSTFSLGYKRSLNDRLDLAIIIDEPIGADVAYPDATFYPLEGTTARLQSKAITGLLRYRFPSNLSVFGGLRGEQVKGDVFINFTPMGVTYNLETNRDVEWGYVAGIAWEKPDIAARVSLTYNSAIDHTLESTEDSNFLPGTVTGDFDTTVPQSVNLEFQTGVAADTLVFGSIRWVDWSEFEISPDVYVAIFGSPLVSYESDRVTYTLGVGRKFSETWSGAVLATYEPSNGDITGNLGPVDGFTGIGLAATYTQGSIKVTGGLRYLWIGDATTTIGAAFQDNTALAAGIRVGMNF